MAVNENLYNWLWKTQGSGAAEWYRNNPNKPHESNPFVNPNEAKWFPKASADDPYRSQQIARDPYRDQTYASVMPEYVEESVVEPAPSSSDYFQQFLNSLNPSQRAEIEGMSDLTAEDKAEIGYDYAARQQLGDLTPAQKTQVNNLITYDPGYGEYGGYITKEDLGFSPRSALYNRYEDWTKNNPVPEQETMFLRAVRDDPTLGGTAGYNPEYADGLYRFSLDAEDLKKLAEYDAAVAARSKAFEDIYKTPLSQLPYTSYSAAREAGKSLEDYRASLAQIGIDIPLLEGEGGYFVRGATADDPEVQEAGIYNVGLDRYRNKRINEATQKNIEILKQQASEGVPDAQQYLREYTNEKTGPRGEETGPRTGPRGEILGDIAEVRKVKRDGPASDIYYDKQMKQFVPVMNPGTIILDQLKKADQPKTDFDEQQARVASSAADKYREKAKVEDPFRSGAFG